MISISQIKAARALLGWTQDNLAKQAGLSLPAVNALERGLHVPRVETLGAIQSVLEQAKIEFIEPGGVRFRPEDISTRIFEGDNFIRDYDLDIMSVLTSKTDEICGMHCDERQWISYSGHSNNDYVDYQKQVGFQERIIVPETIDYITSKPDYYRTLPADVFGNLTWQLYGDRYALIFWDSKKVIVHRSVSLAAQMRRQFDFLWAAAKPFSKAQAKKLERWEAGKKV